MFRSEGGRARIDRDRVYKEMDLAGSMALSGDTAPRYREEVELSIEREWPTVAILGIPRSLTIYRSFHRKSGDQL